MPTHDRAHERPHAPATDRKQTSETCAGPAGYASPATPATPAPPSREDTRLEVGLDALESPVGDGAAPSMLYRTLRVARQKALPPLLAVVLLLALWQLVYVSGFKEPYVLPGPRDVLHSFLYQWHAGTVLDIVGNSLYRGGLGFLFAVALGTPLGLLVSRVRPVRAAIGPLLTGMQSLPSVAWVPAAIIWFGLGDATVYAVVLLGAAPSMANGLVAGVDRVPEQYLRAGRVLGARGLRGVRHILLPAALPGYLAGLKQGWAFSWRSLLAAELITTSPDLGPGLGQLLNQGRELADMSLVLCAILLILSVGIGVELLVFAPLERYVLGRRGLRGSR